MAGTALSADATGYRYWSYYHQTAGEWEYSQVRMDSHVPVDGALEAWRFVTAEFGDTSREPRVDISFADVCDGTGSADGEKRIALVIDYGRAADIAGDDEPPQLRAACAVVDEDATTAMALSSVADLRIDDTRLCAIDDHPAEGCNEAVDPLPDTAAEPDDTVQLTEVAGLAGAESQRDSGSGDPAEGEGEAEADDRPAATSDGGADIGAWGGAAVVAVVVAGVAVAVRRARRS
nr:SCO2322 family protein [Phytoactinopolyspora alkaliphila]